MDAWQQSVENRLGQIHADMLDVRGEIRALRYWVLGVLLGGVAAILGTMARGFGWL